MSLFDSISGIFGGSSSGTSGLGSGSQQTGSPSGGTDFSPYLIGAGLLGDIGQGYAAYKNYQMSKDQLSYQKNLNKLLMSREDNAVQRRKADLIAAGFSPVLAAGSGANVGPVVATKSPEIGDLPNPAMTVMSLLKMENDISTTQAQRELIESQKNLTNINSAIKDWDYSKFVEWNLPSNASGLAKTIRDLGSMIQGIGGNVITPAVKKIQDKVDYNKAVYNYNKAKSENERLKAVKSGQWWKMTNREVFNKVKNIGGSKK